MLGTVVLPSSWVVAFGLYGGYGPITPTSSVTCQALSFSGAFALADKY